MWGVGDYNISAAWWATWTAPCSISMSIIIYIVNQHVRLWRRNFNWRCDWLPTVTFLLMVKCIWIVNWHIMVLCNQDWEINYCVITCDVTVYLLIIFHIWSSSISRNEWGGGGKQFLKTNWKLIINTKYYAKSIKFMVRIIALFWGGSRCDTPWL